MCRSLHCLMMMTGHGPQVGSLDELLSMLSQFSPPKQKPEQNHDEWLKKVKETLETNIRASDVAMSVLTKTPPEVGAKLVALEAIRPVDAKKHGILTLATYALESEAFRVIGTDHLTQFTIQHDTPNIHGVEGLQEATRHELEKQSDAAAEADAATAKASASE